ncbi:glutathione S-transferase 1-like [Tribolium castaneum]|uniref:Glutathione S-transferase 1-1-like Protein n=1 Tax=Tribolium castaneum TaxID=7070 RepID=D6WFC4_TRICA|nr:PREDICTED: glutathione S-transferase 1 [Tribolium castaneum]EFA00271.1 Glutathione S-transferase 1-1-like Protein [Tribolium castaneum]|eukprot:XP_971136.1 PREDICTED: glutathione S-transferase 1 [Tribolium castaneum]
MAPTLHLIYASPPVRAVLMTAKAIGLTLKENEINLFGGDHMKPEFLKLNPQHTVPTLVDDDGFAIWDSHAIITYLVSKYAKNDALYPQDVKKRAVVDQRLHFESGTVFVRLLKITRPILFEGKTTIDPKDRDNILEAYGFLDVFLNGKQWVAGDFISVADYSLVSSISSLNVLIPIDAQKYPNVVAWLKRIEAHY